LKTAEKKQRGYRGMETIAEKKKNGKVVPVILNGKRGTHLQESAG